MGFDNYNKDKFDSVIRWDCLSWQLKIAVLGGWLSAILFVLGFIKGILTSI